MIKLIKQQKAQALLLIGGLLYVQMPPLSAQSEIDCDTVCEIEAIRSALPIDSSIQKVELPENSERHLPDETLTLWALPTQKPVPPVVREHSVTSNLAGEDSPITFRSGKAFIEGTALDQFQSIADRLKIKKNLRLHFIGHTDSQRLSAYTRQFYADNQELSEARARVVAQFFKSALNLPDDAVTYQGKADRVPIASNDTKEGMAKNRRVEMKIWYEEEIITTPPPIQLHKARICEGGINAVNQNNEFDGFRISIDGKTVNGKVSKQNADLQRCTDVALDKAKIQLQYNNLTTQPRLNITALPKTADIDGHVQFQGFTNYRSWFQKAEVRLFEIGQSPQATPLAIVPLDSDMSGTWADITTTSAKIAYRLRVYDNNGHFDETKSHTLWLKNDKDNGDTQETDVLFDGYDKNHLAIRNIPVQGGTLTVYGENIPDDHQVFFLGMPVPVADDQKFVTEHIIGNGGHTVEVAVLDETGNGDIYWRDLKFEEDDWFIVALADLTVGENKTTGPADLVTGNTHYYGDEPYADGRIAFYAKGKISKKYQLTASVDTREKELDQLLKNFDEKSPETLLRKLDEEQYYSVYGDDSTTYEDAPTQGKAYLKIEDEQSHIMWGNFKTHIHENELARIDRGLYGAQAQWQSLSSTEYGERKTAIQAFAADPGTLAAREEFRGTGGSLYYLQHQNITQGSEQLSIEIRDKDSGIVLSSHMLASGVDYTLNTLQGRILLTSPLSSVADGSTLVRAGSLSGNPAFLVATYEYSPLFNDLDEAAVGGRASHWFNDHVSAGMTLSKQEQSGGDQRLNAIDLLVRKTPETYIKVEVAESKGEGTGTQFSDDGGFTFTPLAQNRQNDLNAAALRVESGFKINDLGLDNPGRGGFYLQHREDGFSAPGQLTLYDTSQIGTHLSAPVTESTELSIKADLTDEDGGYDTQSAEVGISQQLNSTWRISSALKNEHTKDDAGVNTNTGYRNDLAIQLDQKASPDVSNYLFAQGTLSKSDARRENNRAGLGTRRQLSDRLSLNGEISGGTGGLGGKAGSEFHVTDSTDLYLTYALDTDRTHNSVTQPYGQFISGARTRYTDAVSIFGEARVQHGDTSGVSQVYGVDYSPKDTWKLGLSFETGELEDQTGSKTDRSAATISMGLRNPSTRFGTALEYRKDETEAETRTAWLTRNNLGYQLSPSWRSQFRLDLAFNESDQGDYYNGDYTLADIGMAYRPVDHDTWNALFRYTYLEDLAPADQIANNGSTGNWQQRSHVLALDTTYDLSLRWSIGGKYAIRVGEIREGRETGPWTTSHAQLVIGRLNWHLVRRWDLLAEGRVLMVEEAEDQRAGVLTAAHYHFGKHIKGGIGYNFTDFSDDLTDLDYDSRGWFLNIVGKY